MWRRSLHAELGEFDAEMKSAGDYEFWLRAAKRHRFHHLAQPLGLYLERPDALSLGNIDLSWHEGERASERHWNRADGPPPQHRRVQRQFAALNQRVGQLARGTRIALYGAGKHTARMLGLFREAIEPHATLVGILDDAPAGVSLASLAGVLPLPVLPTNQWRMMEPQIVVVSSDTYEMAMYANVRAALPESVEIWRVYQSDAPAAFIAPSVAS